jgi:hypothetical protein
MRSRRHCPPAAVVWTLVLCLGFGTAVCSLLSTEKCDAVSRCRPGLPLGLTPALTAVELSEELPDDPVGIAAPAWATAVPIEPRESVESERDRSTGAACPTLFDLRVRINV